MRRTDRAVTDPDEIDAILRRCEVGRLGLWSHGEPYVVPLHFAHIWSGDQVVVYIHGAGEGRKIEAISQGGRACFEADRRIETVDHARVCRIGATFESAIGWGLPEVCGQSELMMEGLVALLDKYSPGRSGELTQRDAAMVTVLRMPLDTITAKRRA
ncbi:MAG: pyridoxamine 5'-phosphate oxidase family protein [Bifidobacteriaceae bacterium]|jgi:nitroimidazol reductase NimA-like FMN-containing flavoprotein (pyridoxamine 5'-phosphate oxidase superfamily)|nr:pyridoxamine 5'-phosphate oxidase family protein [Bifidobacteriaceae bacterium]